MHLYRIFDYLPPSTTQVTQKHLGCRVWVPLRKKRVLGLIVGCGTSELEPAKLQTIEQIIDSESIFPPRLWELLLWAAEYYCHPLGQALNSALPTLLREGRAAQYRQLNCWELTAAGALQDSGQVRGLRLRAALQRLQEFKLLAQPALKLYGLYPGSMRALAAKGWAQLSPSPSKPSYAKGQRQDLPPANADQQRAIDAISASGGFQRHLLFGVTGSGKTLVFLSVINKLLTGGGQALVLIPEIGLSPQTLDSFVSALDLPTLVLHSALSEQERLDGWLAARAGEARVIIGTRSALFIPMSQLRLIVIDEEQDHSYKQQDGFRYSARDLAIKRAQLEDIPVLLASATPALESWRQQSLGHYQLHQLPERAGSAQQARFHLLDLRAETVTHGFGASTLTAIEKQLAAGRQVLVFVNRRGFSPVLQCFACGWLAFCPACEQSLNLHQRSERLLCHHCGHSQPIPSHCPSCGSLALKPIGVGTERGEQYLGQIFAGYPLLRVDSDTMTKRTDFARLHATLAANKACLLLGTQMLAKGHHFPNLTLVVVQDIDGAFYCNDFFAQERIGQLILQVGGRAGRGHYPGEVLIQTRMPENPLFRSLLSQDYAVFAEQLLQERARYQLAPYSHLAYLRADSKQPQVAYSFLQNALSALAPLRSDQRLVILDPLPALQPKRAYYFRFVVVLQSSSRALRAQALQLAIAYLQQHSQAQVRWSVDVDPKEGF